MNGSLAELKKKVHTVTVYTMNGSLQNLLRWRKGPKNYCIFNEWLTCWAEEKGPHSYIHTMKGSLLAEMKKKVHTPIYKEWFTCLDEEKGPHSFIQRMAHLLRWRKRSTQLYTKNGSLAEMKKKVHTVINNEWLTCCNEEKGPHSYIQWMAHLLR